jgi:hypothetical protein
MLDGFNDWTPDALEVVRQLALSLARLRQLEAGGDVREVRREVRCVAQLRKLLDLER